MVHEVEVGKNVRLSYSKIKEVLDMPNLIEVQKDSYKWFLEEGLKEIIHDISPITTTPVSLYLNFLITDWITIQSTALKNVRKGIQSMPLL